MKAWFTDLRKTALVACVAAVLGLLIPMWHAAQVAIRLTDVPWWSKLMGLLAFPFAPIMPLFYFALYRSEIAPRISRRLGLLSLAAAIILGAIVAVDVVKWIGSLGAASVLVGGRDPRTIRDASILLGMISSLACILVLIALFREASEESVTEVSASRLLRFATMAAVIAGGLILTFALIQLVFRPYGYFQLRNYALQMGRRPPPLAAMMEDAIRAVLSQACLFTAPFVVYRRGLD